MTELCGNISFPVLEIEEAIAEPMASVVQVVVSCATVQHVLTAVATLPVVASCWLGLFV